MKDGSVAHNLERTITLRMIISSLCEGKRNETVVDETVVANMHPVLFLKLILVLQNINPFVLRMW
jgi:hypothetical protein